MRVAHVYCHRKSHLTYTSLQYLHDAVRLSKCVEESIDLVLFHVHATSMPRLKKVLTDAELTKRNRKQAETDHRWYVAKTAELRATHLEQMRLVSLERRGPQTKQHREATLHFGVEPDRRNSTMVLLGRISYLKEVRVHSNTIFHDRQRCKLRGLCELTNELEEGRSALPLSFERLERLHVLGAVDRCLKELDLFEDSENAEEIDTVSV